MSTSTKTLPDSSNSHSRKKYLTTKPFRQNTINPADCRICRMWVECPCVYWHDHRMYTQEWWLKCKQRVFEGNWKNQQMLEENKNVHVQTLRGIMHIPRDLTVSWCICKSHLAQTLLVYFPNNMNTTMLHAGAFGLWRNKTSCGWKLVCSNEHICHEEIMSRMLRSCSCCHWAPHSENESSDIFREPQTHRIVMYVRNHRWTLCGYLGARIPSSHPNLPRLLLLARMQDW